MFQAQYSTPKISKRLKKKMDGPHVSGPIFNPKNQQEMEEKNGSPMVQAQNRNPRGKTKVNTRVVNSWSLGCGLTTPGEDISII